MDISKIDKNFVVGSTFNKNGYRFYNIPSEPFDLYGVFYENETERFVRMPSAVADKVNDGVAYLNSNTAGGRVRFSTDSDVLALSVTYAGLCEMSHMPLSGSSGFTLLREEYNGFTHVKTFMPDHTGNTKNGFEQAVSVCGEQSFVIYDKKYEGKMQNYILFFPLYNDVKTLSIGIRDTAKVDHGKAYAPVKPILYYGSSITQGGCADRADNAYQAIISKRNNIDFINLGFSGSGRAEKIMCDYLADVDCSVFVCDYDHNAPDAEYLKETHYKLYETFRKKQPKTPVIFISKPDMEHDFHFSDRFSEIKSTYERAKANGDKNVYLINGKDFFSDDRDSCTVDGCHPNTFGFFKMAKVIEEVLESVLQIKK